MFRGFATICGAVCLFAGCEVVWADESEDELVVAMSMMERQLSEIGPYEVKFSAVEKLSLGKREGVTQETRLAYRQCVDGTRRRLECTGLMDVNTPKSPTDLLSVETGGRHGDFDRAARRGEIGKRAAFPPDYVSGAYLFPEGLFARLQKNRQNLRPSREAIADTRMLKVVWMDEKWETEIVVWLNPARCYQPAQLLIDSVIGPGIYSDGRERMVYRVVVSDYWQSERTALPSRVRTIRESVWPDGRRKVESDQTMIVSAVVPNAKFSPEEFEIVYPKGTLVTDVERRVYYVEGEPGSERRLGQSGDRASGASGSTDVGSWIISPSLLWLLGGALLVALGVFLKMRAGR